MGLLEQLLLQQLQHIHLCPNAMVELVLQYATGLTTGQGSYAKR
jgi:hypothetical protein